MAYRQKIKPILQELYSTEEMKEIHTVGYWINYIAQHNAQFEEDRKTGEVTIYQGTPQMKVILKKLRKY